MSAPVNASLATGARAAAAAATTALSKTEALVRLPSPPLAATLEEELGLPAPEFHDIPLSPCVVRMRSDGSRELLIAAPTLESALAVNDAEAASATLDSAAFVQLGGDLLLLRAVEPLQIQGRAYLYRLLLRDATAEVRP